MSTYLTKPSGCADIGCPLLGTHDLGDGYDPRTEHLVRVYDSPAAIVVVNIVTLSTSRSMDLSMTLFMALFMTLAMTLPMTLPVNWPTYWLMVNGAGFPDRYQRHQHGMRRGYGGGRHQYFTGLAAKLGRFSLFCFLSRSFVFLLFVQKLYLQLERCIHRNVECRK